MLLHNFQYHLYSKNGLLLLFSIVLGLGFSLKILAFSNTPVVICITSNNSKCVVQGEGSIGGDGGTGGNNSTIPSVTKTNPAICLQIKNADSHTQSGIYKIDPDGVGSIAAFSAYCDMTTNGGGYTLIQSYGTGSKSSEGVVNLGSDTYLPLATAQALANLSTKLRISERNTNNYVESIDSWPISQLSSGRYVNDNANKNGNHFTGNMTSHLQYSCDANDQEGQYPMIYWACGNENGLHIRPISSYVTHGWSNNQLNIDVWLK